MPTFTFYNSLNETLAISDPLFRGTITGLGKLVQRSTDEAAYQDGATIRNEKLPARIVSFPLQMLCDSLTEKWEKREEILGFFATIDQDSYLRVTGLPDGSTRQLDIRDNEIMMPVAHDRGPVAQDAVIQLFAADPLFYDPTPTRWTFAVAGGTGSWGFPLGFPEGFGGSTISRTEPRVYVGNYVAYPIITIDGPAEDIKISNETTGDDIEFLDAYSIAVSEQIVIDTRPGYKTVVREDDTNIIAQLKDGHDLGTFHIERHPKAVNGANEIGIDLIDAASTTLVTIEFNTKWIGV